jgi:DDE superfamily endonuclease
LYLNPPENALVLCVDEKPSIQALDRTQPLLPLRAKKPRSWTNEYVRHGTQTLLAALEIGTGKVVAHVRDRRTTVDFLSFMYDVVKSYPSRELHVVLDNLNIHKNEAAKQWLLRHPRVHLGAATLERRSSRLDIGVADPVRCGIASTDQSRRRDGWLGVGRGLQPSVQSSACRNAPCGP